MRSRASPCSERSGNVDQERHAETDQQRAEPAVELLDQDVIDENRGHSGHDQPREHQQQADPGDEADGRIEAFQPAPQPGQQVRWLAARREAGPALELQRHARETIAELLARDAAWSHPRIVEIDLIERGTLDDHEVVEVPEHDQREGAREDLINLATHAHGLKPVAPRRPHDVAGLAAVARDAAGHAQFLERHAPSEVSEHDAERRRAAFHHLHLEDGWRADPAP